MPDGIPAVQSETRGTPEIAAPAAGYVHELSDGTTVTAENAAEAIRRCPVLGSMPLEQANILLELSAIGAEAIPHRGVEQPAEVVPEEQVDKSSEKTAAVSEHIRPVLVPTEPDTATPPTKRIEPIASHETEWNLPAALVDHAVVQAEAVRDAMERYDAELPDPTPLPFALVQPKPRLVTDSEETVSPLIARQLTESIGEPVDVSAQGLEPLEFEAHKAREPDRGGSEIIELADDTIVPAVELPEKRSTTALTELSSLAAMDTGSGGDVYRPDKADIDSVEQVGKHDVVMEVSESLEDGVEDVAEYDDEVWALFAELQAVAMAPGDYGNDMIETRQSDQSEEQEVRESFEQFAAISADREVRTFDELQAKADEQPLEQTLVDLGVLLSEKADDGGELIRVAEVVRDIVESLPELDAEGLLPADLETYITPEITHKLVSLLRSVGYSEPREVLLALVSERGMRFLIEGVAYLYRMDKGDVLPERSNSHIVLAMSAGTNKHHSLGRVILRLLRKDNGQSGFRPEVDAFSGSAALAA